MEFQNQIKTAIDLISISIRTAPKSGGADDIVFVSVNSQLKNRIADEMVAIGRENAKGKPEKKIREAIVTSWSTDARTVRNSQGLILIGVKGKKALGLNCGGCGFKNCAEFSVYIHKSIQKNILGPFCMFKIWDLGIATDSAAKTASMLNIDNRIMYKIGIAVLRLKLFTTRGKKKGTPANDISPVLGLPLSVSGKNIFFDRLDKLQASQILAQYYKAKR
jgi:uncharacterized ferredoxin-like protein